MTSPTIAEIITYNNGDTGELVLNYLTFSFITLFTLMVTCFAPVNPQTKILERTLSIPLFMILFSIQIGFFYALRIVGISLIWAGFLGFNTRQSCFYYSWIRMKYAVMFIQATSIILAAITYVYTAAVADVTAVLYMMIIIYVFGLLLGYLCFYHVSKQANRTTAVMNYLLQSQIEQLELVCREQERSLQLEKNLRRHFENLNREHNLQTLSSYTEGENRDQQSPAFTPMSCQAQTEVASNTNWTAARTEEKIDDILNKMEALSS